MRLLEVPKRTLEDEILALEDFALADRGEEFMLGARMALQWILNGKKTSPSQFLYGMQDHGRSV